MKEKTTHERWEELKARGNPTTTEIEAIDKDTTWVPREPGWWCEMMRVYRQLQKIRSTK